MHYLIFTALAIGLWASLATLVVNLAHVPPFLLLSMTLLIGGSLSIGKYRQWQFISKLLFTGVSGIFGYHLLLFLALRFAPPLSANLINYLWPIFILLFTPIFLPEFHFNRRHLLGGVIAFAGAVLAMYQPELTIESQHSLGFILAFGAAISWAFYSLTIKRYQAVSSANVGLFCLISGLLALGVHGLLEQTPELSSTDIGNILILGVGPMGIAFYCWDKALKIGDPRVIAVCSYATPLLSTLLLATFSQQQLSPYVIYAMVLIPVGAFIASRASR